MRPTAASPRCRRPRLWSRQPGQGGRVGQRSTRAMNVSRFATKRSIFSSVVSRSSMITVPLLRMLRTKREQSSAAQTEVPTELPRWPRLARSWRHHRTHRSDGHAQIAHRLALPPEAALRSAQRDRSDWATTFGDEVAPPRGLRIPPTQVVQDFPRPLVQVRRKVDPPRRALAQVHEGCADLPIGQRSRDTI
jgi:hypothetical protein